MIAKLIYRFIDSLKCKAGRRHRAFEQVNELMNQ